MVTLIGIQIMSCRLWLINKHKSQNWAHFSNNPEGTDPESSQSFDFLSTSSTHQLLNLHQEELLGSGEEVTAKFTLQLLVTVNRYKNAHPHTHLRTDRQSAAGNRQCSHSFWNRNYYGHSVFSVLTWSSSVLCLSPCLCWWKGQRGSTATRICPGAWCPEHGAPRHIVRSVSNCPTGRRCSDWDGCRKSLRIPLCHLQCPSAAACSLETRKQGQNRDPIMSTRAT